MKPGIVPVVIACKTEVQIITYKSEYLVILLVMDNFEINGII